MNVVLDYSAGPYLTARLRNLQTDGLTVTACPQTESSRFDALLQETVVLWHVIEPLTAAVIGVPVPAVILIVRHLPHVSTRYAAGFDGGTFDRIQTGDVLDHVHRTLAKPMLITAGGDQLAYRYYLQPSTSPSNGVRRCLVVDPVRGAVLRIVDQTVWDAPSYLFSPAPDAAAARRRRQYPFRGWRGSGCLSLLRAADAGSDARPWKAVDQMAGS